MKRLLDFDVDRALLERAARQPSRQTPPARAPPSRRGRLSGLVDLAALGLLDARGWFVVGVEQRLEDARVGQLLGLALDLRDAVVVHLGDGLLEQVANDRLDVAPDVAHLGELGRLDFDERRCGEARDAARDLRLADTRRSDHEDVLGQHLAAQLVGQLLSPDPVAKRDRHRFLGVALTDDVLVEAAHHLDGPQLLSGDLVNDAEVLLVRRRRLVSSAVLRRRDLRRVRSGRRLLESLVRQCAHRETSEGMAPGTLSSVSTVMLSLV